MITKYIILYLVYKFITNDRGIICCLYIINLICYMLIYYVDSFSILKETDESEVKRGREKWFEQVHNSEINELE